MNLSANQVLSNNEARHTNSVTESISKYKRKRMESLSKKDTEFSGDKEQTHNQKNNTSK